MARIAGPIAVVAAAFAVTYLLFGHAPGCFKKSQPAAAPGMLSIPGGEFTMGTDSDLGWADEKPAHRVRVDGF
jgi:formylglycine-generating enzyme